MEKMMPIMNCPTCEGKGTIKIVALNNKNICRTCKGTGKIIINSLIIEKRDIIESNKK